MKNVYLYIVFLLIGFSGFAQDLQNANWLFGLKAGLRFVPPTNPGPIGGSDMSTWESCASVSDDSGNLLFYTDGQSVWGRNNLKMPNGSGLLGDDSSTQIAILPKPNHPNIYYIITINGSTGTKAGLTYSVVDMALNNGYGNVTSKNVYFQDHLGVNINYSYFQDSEKVTTAKHSNDIDYWVITQIKEYIYSYKVTDQGISIIPEQSTVAPIATTQNVPIGNASWGVGSMKISPNGRHIGICYSGKSTIALGEFDSFTGIVSFYPNLVLTIAPGQVYDHQKQPYGIEFSPSSQNVYVSSPHHLYKMTSSGLNMSEITIPPPINNNGGWGALQLAIDGKIYFTRFYNSANNNKIAVINNPNDLNNPNFVFDATSIGNKEDGGLPQWVHKQKNCVEVLTLLQPNNDVQSTYQDNQKASKSITASNIVNYNAVAIYHAGEDVLLKHGFYSVNGSELLAYIQGCESFDSGEIIKAQEEETMRVASTDEESGKDLFTLYPNPAIESVTIASDKLMQNVTVTSLDGFTLFHGDVRTNSYDLNVSNYRKGIYVITVTTEGGEVEMKKLMKE